MAYNINTFLQPISNDDKNILIYKEDGTLVYTINPYSVTNIQVRANIITISIKSGRTILLDFLTSPTALNALPILQERIFTLTERNPNFIDKQISNWVENYTSSQNLVGTITISGTLSMSGNIIPDLDYTWNLGSTNSRWNNIYVRDALVASQSIYLGDLKLSNKNGDILAGNKAISKYEGTSENFLAIPNVDAIVAMTTQTNLSFKYGDTVKVYNKEENFAEDDNYSEDSVYSYFLTRVDNYNPSTGNITLIVNYAYNKGLTFSFWHIKLNTDFVNTISNRLGETFSFTSDIITDQDDTYRLGSPDKRWSEIHVNNAFIDNPNIGFEQLENRPLFTNDSGRWQNFQGKDPNDENRFIGEDFQIKDAHLYLDGTASLRFTNFGGTLSNKLISVWDWDGPLGSIHTSIPEYEATYNERAQISFKIEDGEKSSVSLKSFDWTAGTNSGIEHEYKFYQGDIIIDEGKGLYSGGLKFSSRITGTSSDLLEVLEKGNYFQLTTQKYLSFERGITVIVSNGLEDFYVDDDYLDDANGAVMFAIVDSYNETTGVLGLYVEKAIGLGRTASSWSINISGRQSTLELGPTASFEELTITGTSNIQQVVELLTTATATGLSPSTYDLNFDDGSIFYVEPQGDNFYANYINVPNDDNRIISTTLIISQSSTAYIPDNVLINGESVTISWANGLLPTGNANQTDIVGFTFMRRGGVWSNVFGQLSTFAPI